MNYPNWVRKFVFPKLSRAYLVRLAAVAVGAALVFSFVLVPARIKGASMEPTYRDGGFAFCWRQRYLFGQPRRGDVVMVRFAGKRIMLLKRVVALAGDTLEFRRGVLYLNGVAQDEEYVRSPCDWDLAERTVKPGHVYVVGDNRGMAMDGHRFGQTQRRRIMGAPVW